MRVLEVALEVAGVLDEEDEEEPRNREKGLKRASLLRLEVVLSSEVVEEAEEVESMEARVFLRFEAAVSVYAGGGASVPEE